MRKPLEKIKLVQLYTLCNTIAESNLRQISFIKAKYLENALWFDETLSLLEDLTIIKNNFVELIPSETFFKSLSTLEEFKKQLLNKIFISNGEVSEQLREFLVNFKVETNQVIFNSTPTEKVKYSDTRNLLLELDFISTNQDSNMYIVNPCYHDLFTFFFNKRAITPEIFKTNQTENDVLGLSAEKAVIEFEIQRLTNIKFDKSEIEHTSQKNVIAGYDVKSFENYLDDNSKRIQRYIEVKAVPVFDYRFYWSRNEIEFAKIFGEKYFLYLLPVNSNSTFDFEKMKIISNPIKNIYLNYLDWNKKEECLSFSMKTEE